MSDAMRKVRSGEPLAIPAQAYNAFIDAATDFRNRTASTGRHATPSTRQADIVLVRNDSGAPQDQFAVLGIDTPVIDPADNESEFTSRVVLSCVTPAVDTHEGRFVILAEPLAGGMMGRAYIAGVCPVQVNVSDEAHTFATIIDADATQLASATSGSAQILWKESGTGTKWAIVRIGNAQAAAGLVQLRVKEVSTTEDWLRCRTWDGATEGAEDVYVARPYTMRRTPYDGQTIDGKTYSFLVQSGILVRHIVFSDSSFERQKITPPYLVNDIIYAMPAATGVTVLGSPVALLDINCDGRAWAENDIYS